MRTFPEQSGFIRPDSHWIVKTVKHKEPVGTYTVAIIGKKNYKGRTEYSYDYLCPDEVGTTSTSGFYSSMAEALKKAITSIRDDIQRDRRIARLAKMSPESRASQLAKKRLDEATKFFYKHAGYSHGPGQTAQQGHKEGARKLAIAEQYGEEARWTVKWEYDDLPYEMGDAETPAPDEVLCATLVDENGHVLESLSGIADPSDNYRRVVEAELIFEAMPPELLRS